MTFDTLYARRSRAVRSALLRLGVQDKDVCDAVQDVFAIVWRKLPSFEGRSTVDTWIHGICRRVASDYRRSAWQRREILTPAPMSLDTASNELLESALERAQTQAMVERSLNALEPQRRELLVAFELHETPMHDLAELMECPLQTAYARLYSARRSLRELLAEAAPAS